MSLPISKPQQDLLRTFQNFAARHGRTPSVRELCRALDKAPSTIHQLLRALESKDLMESNGRAHGWKTRIADGAGDAGRVRIRGTIAAGSPIEAIETREDVVSLPGSLPGDPSGADTFALRVRGDSMIDDHILDGDVVLVKRQSKVDDGEIAVALLEDGTATLKRVYREPGKKRIRLQPANSKLGPIYVSRVDIQGRVIGVVRSFQRR